MVLRGRRPSVPDQVFDDVPFVEGEKREPPQPYRKIDGLFEYEQLHPVARKTWEELRVLPHAVAWTEPEWSSAEHAVLCLHYFHSAEKPASSLAAEARHVLRPLGYTADDRAAQRIVYRPVGDADEAAEVATAGVSTSETKPAGAVASMAEWRDKVS